MTGIPEPSLKLSLVGHLAQSFGFFRSEMKLASISESDHDRELSWSTHIYFDTDRVKTQRQPASHAE